MSSKEVSKKAAGGALAQAMDYGELAGSGFEGMSNEDMMIPFLSVLQAGSPQVEQDSPPGSKAGMLFNTVTERLSEDAIVVPCCTEHVYVEWRPRDEGGGFAGVHQLDSAVVREARAKQKFGEYKVGGNDLVETFYIYGLLLESPDQQAPGEPIVIAFTSTKIKRYKAAMSRLRMFTVDNGHGKKVAPPLFAHRLRISTTKEKNTKGTFFNYDVKSLNGDVAHSLIPPELPDGGPHPLLEAGAELVKSVRGGLARASYETANKTGGGDAAEEEDGAF